MTDIRYVQALGAAISTILSLRLKLEKAGSDVRHVIAMADWLQEACAEDLEDEDAALLHQIRADYPSPPQIMEEGK